MSLCRYIPHINNIIHLPAANKDFEWVDAATKEPHLLSYDSSQTLGYEFRGTAAVLLTEKQTRMCFKPMLCAHLLLEVNKELTDRNVIQAQAKLLLANMHDPERRPVLVSRFMDVPHSMCMKGHLCSRIVWRSLCVDKKCISIALLLTL